MNETPKELTTEEKLETATERLAILYQFIEKYTTEVNNFRKGGKPVVCEGCGVICFEKTGN